MRFSLTAVVTSVYIILITVISSLLKSVSWKLNSLHLAKSESEYKKIDFYLKNLNLLNFFKFSFTGKGYRLVLNNRNSLAFSFGFSHRVQFYAKYCKIYHISKTKVLFVGVSHFFLKKSTSAFFRIKPLNIFTWRGIKPSKGALRKKTGKVSLYF